MATYTSRTGLLLLTCCLAFPGIAHAVYPAPWPASWTVYTVLGNPIFDPDSSTDGTYGVSATPSVVDYFPGTSGTMPSVYYAYDATNQVFFIGVRMRGDPFKSFGTSGPYDAYAWHIVFDLTGDGYKDFVIVLDGMSGKQSDPYDDIELYYSALARRQDFNSATCAGGGDQVWIQNATDGSSNDYDFAYTRRVDDTANGGGYLLDIQVPLSAMKDCSGNQILYESTPFTLVFTTSTQNNNPTQKDLVAPGTYTMSATAFLPGGDPMTLKGGITQTPLMTDLRCSCAGNNMTLTGYTMDTLVISGGSIVDTINNVTYYYWNGSTWVQIGSPVTTPNANTVNEWAVTWNTTGLSGTYPLRVVVRDDQNNVLTDETRGVDIGTCQIRALLAMFKSFDAWRLDDSVLVEWQTSSEVGTAGFYLYREDPVTGESQLVNDSLVPGLLHAPQGGVYQLIDRTGGTGDMRTYKLVEVDIRGQTNTYGPVTVHLGDRGKASLPEAFQTPVDGSTGTSYARRAHESSVTRRSFGKFGSEGSPPRGGTGNRLRIAVTERGLYHVEAVAIASALGLGVEYVQRLIKHQGLRLGSQGKAVPYLPARENLGIYFYGQEAESPYAKENIYWLRVGQGEKMRAVRGPEPQSAHDGETFAETLHFEENQYPAVALVSDPHVDFWFWDYIVGGDVSLGMKAFTLRAEGVASAQETGTLIVRLQGITDTHAIGPEHHVAISLNGTPIGEGQWSGRNRHELTLPFDPHLLVDGDNTVEVRGILNPNIPYSVFYVDSFDLSYRRYCRAVDDVLKVDKAEDQVITIEGFSNPEILVFDISRPNHPAWLKNTVWESFNGGYRVSFNAMSQDSVFIASAADAIKTPSLTVMTASRRLKREQRGADYLMIAPEEFKERSQDLALYRRGQGLSTFVATVEEIYDEFNHGLTSPEAIKRFLTHAYRHWDRRPRYVVLVGNGTYDFKDRASFGDDLIPPLLLSTPYGLIASDQLLADVVGDDGIPDLAIGRLPVRTLEDLDAVISKIIVYENRKGDWNRHFLMVADDPDDGGDFPSDSDKVAFLIPGDFSVDKIYLSEHPVDEVRQLLMDGIESGTGLLNYIGHGGFDRLANEGLLLTTDIASLTNGNRLPLVAAMTCLVNRFELPGLNSLGQTLFLLKGGGAAAVWGPTGLASEDDLMILNEGFLNALLHGETRALGDAVLKALRDLGESGRGVEAGLIYNLLGDPSLQIGF